MLRKSNLGFRVFSEQQCQELHSAAMEVLERVGVEIPSDRALEVAKSAGAYVEGNRVRFPAALVEKCIRSAPSRVVLCDRDENRKMRLEGDRLYFGPRPTTIYTIDPLTGERNVPGLTDTQRASRVMDAQKKLLGIIEKHQPPQLDAETHTRLHAIVERLQCGSVTR